jgi:hypothetical protein
VIVFGGRLETISGHVRHAQDATFMQVGLAAKGACYVLMNHCWLSGTLPADSRNSAL